MLEFNLSRHTPILQSLLNTNQEIIGYSVIYLMFLYKLIKYNNINGTMLGSSLPPVVCRRAYVLFTLFVFVCMWWCAVFCFVFLRLVCHVLPVSLECLFMIAPWVTFISYSGQSAMIGVLLESYRIQKFYADETLKSDQHRIK